MRSGLAVNCLLMPRRLMPRRSPDISAGSARCCADLPSCRAATVLIRLIGFVVITLFARKAGPQTFGTYAFALALASFVVGAPTNFGIGTLGIRKIARDPADTGKVVGEALAVQAIIAAVAVALLVALVPLLSTDQRTR